VPRCRHLPQASHMAKTLEAKVATVKHHVAKLAAAVSSEELEQRRLQLEVVAQ
jgi:hypothetical protein